MIGDFSMKHFDKIGFALVLIGLGGMAEAYGFNKSLAISLSMIIAGGAMILIGDIKNDTENYKRSNTCDSRPYFLH